MLIELSGPERSLILLSLRGDPNEHLRRLAEDLARRPDWRTGPLRPADDVMALARDTAALRGLDDATLAARLQEVWNHLDMRTIASSLVCEAIDRLRRAGGGPRPLDQCAGCKAEVAEDDDTAYDIGWAEELPLCPGCREAGNKARRLAVIAASKVPPGRGPTPPDEDDLRRLAAMAARPGEAAWDAVFARRLGRQDRTLWQWVRRADPTFPDSGPVSEVGTDRRVAGWARVPDRDTLLRALTLAAELPEFRAGEEIDFTGGLDSAEFVRRLRDEEG